MQSALAAAGTPAASQSRDAINAKPDTKRLKSDQKHSIHKSKPTKPPPGPPWVGASSHVSADGTSNRVKTPAISAKSKAGKHKLPSGDDLGDEFPVEIEDAEDVGKKEKKAIINPSLDSTTGTLAKGTKSKHKVVSF